MIFNGKEIEFPAIAKVSFYAVIDSIREMSKDKEAFGSNAATTLLQEIEKYPALYDGVEDLEELKKYKKVINKLARMMFPDVLTTNEIKALTPPMIFQPLFASRRFEGIMEASEGDFTSKMMDITPEEFYLFTCYFILGSYFGYPSHGGGPLSVEAYNKDQGIYRSYQMGVNADMIRFEPTDKAVDITRDDFKLLVDNPADLDLWKSKFPPNSWIMKGVVILNLMDVTHRESLSKITSNLLVKTEDSLENIRSGLKSLFGDSNLRSGVVTFEDGMLTQMHDDELKSIILGGERDMDCEEGLCGYSIDTILRDNKPLIISDVKQFHKKSKSQLSKSLIDQEILSYIMVPLVFEEKLMGFMELGANNPYELNAVSISKVEPLVPILAMAMARFKAEEQNLIEAIIQQECTTIHSSVKWRFEEEARKFLQARYAGKQGSFTDLVFKDVVPLFGQLDIKGSSTRRNEAVKADLNTQINKIRNVLKAAQTTTEMTAYEELLFRLESFKKRLKGDLTAGIEQEFGAFVRANIDPVFDHLKRTDKRLKKLVEQYENMLEPELKIVYDKRKKYDKSVNKINQVLASALDKKQEEAQKIFPHYYERYKTDGIEYNMYIGQSMSKNGDYDPIYLRNLRIWQLQAMWSLENEFQTLRETLDIDVEIASMVLAYSTPLAVHFRMDEKRFDVEGAYNARYEIQKSRIDKAHIKGTDERIRQPGKLAIIYGQEHEAEEYRQFLDFLAAKGYFKGKVEDVELEDLQGIHGLRALRINFNYKKRDTGMKVDEFLKSIEAVN